VFDGDRAPIEDALIDLWQANSAGRYRHHLDARDDIALDPGFSGFGSAATEFQTGAYWFETVKPGAAPDGHGGQQAPHVNLIVQARGMLMPSFTRVYFPEDGQAHHSDVVLSTVPPDRRYTLIAVLSASTEHGEMPVYTFDIRFQGDDETVFFDL
jgi:protocatechuate 3,4-dioxygenase alpha subunit